MSPHVDALATDMARRLFGEFCNRPVIEAAESGVWPAVLWDRLAELELGAALVSEEWGGYGLSIADALAIVREAGRCALPVPLPELMLANHVLTRAGLQTQRDPAVLVSGDGLAIKPCDEGWAVDGTIARVPWGRVVRVVLLVQDAGRTVLVPLEPGETASTDGANIAGEPRDSLAIHARIPTARMVAAPGGLDGEWLRTAGAVLRCNQMAGAIERIAELTVAYALTRSQFGRPIGRFQAVQQMIARLAGETASARAAADLATEAFAAELDILAIASAKIRIGEAAGIAAALAHQVHGAIGFSREYELQVLTRRLWSWRDEMGNERSWSRRLGRHLAARPARKLWAGIAAIGGGVSAAASSPAAEQLRVEVRCFLDEALADRKPAERAETWNGFDAAFSRKVGEKGWIGMTWPKRYGGHERSALERYVVQEEMLAAGAPVAAHWIADRQSGPALLRYGVEEQRQSILPRIARGECFFGIGMSEPDSGSDLASVRTRAIETNDGYVVNGTKLWTTIGHRCHYIILFCQTEPAGTDRHAGTSQFLVDMSLPGIEVRPIRALTGEHHFNEIVFSDVRLSHDALLGERGQGWQQVMGELAFERSGPERFLSSFEALRQLAEAAGPKPSDQIAEVLGRLAAHIVVLRRMSRSVAAMLQDGQDPTLQAAIVKDLGATLEQEIPELLRGTLDVEPDLSSPDALPSVAAYLIQHAPSFSLRGGTREILRGIIARGIGLR